MRNVKQLSKILIGGLFLLGLSAKSFADDAILSEGKKHYDMYCARCHGAEGKGDGMDAKRLSVAPRNLTTGIFKFKSTVSGTAPSDEDLLWILNHGMTHGGMPSFANLNDGVKNDLLVYVKSLSTVFKESPAEPLPAPHEKAKVDLKKGKEVFDLMKCASCHGVNGRANGASAATLVDSWGQPILSANLTQGWTYRAGNEPKQIYYRLMAGINGAPMPSYQGALSDADAWQLANFVYSIQTKPTWPLDIKPYVVKSELPTTASDLSWNKAAQTNVNLQSNTYSKGRRERTWVNAVFVQAVRNEKEIAFKLSWNDPTKNDKETADKFLIAFKPREFSGKALDSLYTLYASTAQLEVYAWAADKPDFLRSTTASLENAIRSNNSSSSIKATSSYDDGLWSLVFTLPLPKEEKKEGFQSPISLGFVSWDGTKNTTLQDRSVSKWVYLTLHEEKE